MVCTADERAMPIRHSCGWLIQRDKQHRWQHARRRGVPEVARQKAAAVGGSVSQHDRARHACAGGAEHGGDAGGGLGSEGKEVGSALGRLGWVWLVVWGGDG
jgi:hypothetical protein